MILMGKSTPWPYPPPGVTISYQIDPQALMAQNHPLQGLFGQPAPLAYRTDAGYQGVLGHFTPPVAHDFPSSLYPCRNCPYQVTSRSRDRPPRHAPPLGRLRWRAKPWRPFPSFFSGGRLVRLITRHGDPAGLGSGFQNQNPPVLGRYCPLAGNYLQQSFKGLAAFRPREGPPPWYATTPPAMPAFFQRL